MMQQKKDVIDDVCRQIVDLIHPQELIVFNVKTSGDTVTAFKVCAVCGDTDPQAAEHVVYLNVDCDVPFDILVYTAQQWARQLQNPYAFAQQIHKMGRRYL